ARSTGLVTIEIKGPGDVDVELSARLQDALGLRHAIVITRSGPPADLRPALGAAAADLLSEVVGPEDVLGLPWARSVSAMARSLFPPASVPIDPPSGTQAPPGEGSSVDVVRRIAALAGGEVHGYYAPMVLDDAESAAVIRRQPGVASTLKR